MNEIEQTLKNADNESTRSPYWLILDPARNMNYDINVLASQISGPFFCREDAQKYLDSKKNYYGKRARVWCHAGYCSEKYNDFCDRLEYMDCNDEDRDIKIEEEK